MKNLCRLLHCSLLALLVSASTALNPIHSIGVPDPIHQLPSDLPSSIPTSTQTPTATKSTINTPPKCTLSENDLATTLNMTFTDTDSSTGKQITADVNQVISKPDNHGDSQSSMSLTVYLNSSIVFSTSHTTSTNGTVDASINWAALTHTATFNIDPKNNTAGTLDSHPFSLGPLKSFNSSAHLITKRNQPLLQITPEPQYNISIPQLQAGITKGMQACQAQVTAHYGSTTTNSTLIPRDDRTQDLGHFSDTYDASSCVNCEVLATAGIALGETICIATTCWLSFGWGLLSDYVWEWIVSGAYADVLFWE
ncbi:hypothetical protein JMJ35_002396 [Cladonia borealis]|uniref:Uncharacterized protein n=1 Tax=Cladonia borealis TaxID=184061 RepID=A0AA39R504_9LECA|nr:hypothetical protein JMJ35_002396 [Cladonia borealis]